MIPFQNDLVAIIKAYPENDVKAFFDFHFIEPLQFQLLGDSKISAEEIRQKMQQTQHIQQILINLSKK
jgi:hypothetical protein